MKKSAHSISQTPNACNSTHVMYTYTNTMTHWPHSGFARW